MERLFNRAKEWLMLDGLRFMGLEQVSMHVCLSFTVMLAVALATVKDGMSWLMQSVKHFTT